MPTNREAQGEVERIVAGLTDAQRDWILALEPTLDEQDCDYDTVFDVRPCVETSPAEYCEESGILLCPADLLWFGSNGCRIGGRAWHQLNATGLLVRQALQTQEPDHG